MSAVSQELQSDSSLKDLIEVLQEIDITGPKANINQTSIDDNNGGRIIL